MRILLELNKSIQSTLEGQLELVVSLIGTMEERRQVIVENLRKSYELYGSFNTPSKSIKALMLENERIQVQISELHSLKNNLECSLVNTRRVKSLQDSFEKTIQEL